jgi:AraC-like DNA-binding protein
MKRDSLTQKRGLLTHAYFPVSEQDMAMGLYVTGAGRQFIAPDEPYPPASHPTMYMFSWNTGRILPEYQLLYIYSGCGEFESQETGRLEVGPGTAIFLIPDVWHRYRPKLQTGWTEGYVSFNGQIPHIWENAKLITPAHAMWKLCKPSRFERKLRMIMAMLTGNKQSEGSLQQSAAFIILTAITDILSDCGPGGVYLRPDACDQQRTTANDPIVSAALELIWNHGHRNKLSVAEIARQVGVTRRTLARHFLQHHGKTLLDEMTTSRLVRSQRFLRETHLPIKRIAHATGFSSSTHLATVFRRELGMTPGQFRGG